MRSGLKTGLKGNWIHYKFCSKKKVIPSFKYYKTNHRLFFQNMFCYFSLEVIRVYVGISPISFWASAIKKLETTQNS